MFGRVPFVSPVQPVEAPKPVEKKGEITEEKKPEKRSAPKKVPHIQVGFSGPVTSAPIFHQTANMFGLDGSELDPVDRNRIQSIIELVAERIGSVDTQKILNFIRRESHKYPGENRFREMHMILCLGQKSEKQKSPWGKTGR